MLVKVRRCCSVDILCSQASIMMDLQTGRQVCLGTGIQWMLVRSVILLVCLRSILCCNGVNPLEGTQLFAACDQIVHCSMVIGTLDLDGWTV